MLDKNFFKLLNTVTETEQTEQPQEEQESQNFSRYEVVSSCCNASIIVNDICSECREHAELITEEY